MSGIIILTRVGRPSGLEIMERLTGAGHQVTAVIAEPRSALLLKKGLRAFLTDSLQKHGWHWLAGKLFEEIGVRVKRLFVTDRTPSIQNRAERLGIPVYIVPNHNGKTCQRLLDELQPEIIITANTRVIKGAILARPRLGTINIHKSKLPQYAGLDSIFWAVYHGEAEIGVTVHLVDEGIDTGSILCQATFPVRSGDTLTSLDETANQVGADLMLQAVELLEKGSCQPIVQDTTKRSYFSWPTAEHRRELARRMPSGKIS